MTQNTTTNISYAQNKEDIILEQIHQAVCDEQTGYFFEIGAGVRGQHIECNTYLLKLRGWDGVIIDTIGDHPLIKNAFVTTDNILDLMSECPKHINIFSIDIDSYDWYIVKKVLDSNIYDIDIICTEINSYHDYKYADLIQHRDYVREGKSNCFGATLYAYKNLLNKYGYSLIYVEDRGVNAFWVKNDKAHLFDNADDFEHHYKKTNIKNSWSRPDPNPRYLTSEELLKEDNNE